MPIDALFRSYSLFRGSLVTIPLLFELVFGLDVPCSVRLQADRPRQSIMADTASASAGADSGAREGTSSMHQPAESAGDVEMKDLSKPQPDPANPETKSSHSHDGENRPIPVPDKDVKNPPNAEASSSAAARHDGPALPENEDLTIDPVESPPNNGALTVNIMLQLTNGVRHPFRIDERYLTKRNVTVTGKTEDGNMDPASITIYTLKELILRDWRNEWDDPPREPSSIRLIHFGKLLEDRNQLSREYFRIFIQELMTEHHSLTRHALLLDYHFSTTSKNWVHMTVKPQDLLDEEEAAKKVKESSSHSGRSGCCVIL